MPRLIPAFALRPCALAALALGCAALALPAQAQPAARKAAASKAAPARTGKTAQPAKASKAAAGKGKARRAAKPAPAAPAAAPAAAPPAARPGAQPTARPAAARPREADYIVAVVNSEPVTNYEVHAGMARIQRQMAERGITPPADDVLRKQVLERLIAERAQLQFAREMGLSVDDAALAQAELSIARQNELPTVEALHQRLTQEGIDVAAFRSDIRNQVLLARLREREIEPRVRVTEADVDTYIRQQTGARAGGQDLNLAMILVAVPENASAADKARLKARAEEALARIKAGEDFAKVAQDYSDANNQGQDGGVLGLRPAERYPELFVQSTQRARVGETVGPVPSDAGYHLLKVLERKQSNALPEVSIPQTHVRHILLTTGPSQSPQVAQERAADFRRRILSGQTSFEELARQHSQDGSAKDGGDLGWASPGQFVPEFEQAMNNLDPGQVSEPVTSRFGVHLIRVDERRERTLSADEQRQLARNVLREKKAEEAFDTWSREVRGRAYVEYRDPPR